MKNLTEKNDNSGQTGWAAAKPPSPSGQLTKVDYKEVTSLDNLNKALERCKNGAPGIDRTTKADMKEKDIEKLHESLKKQTYGPRASKRIYINKPNGKNRPISIPTTRDKIVQAAIYIKLNEKVDPTFSDSSYGFRPGRGCHDALKTIKYKWQATRWLMTFDICKCFDNMNHKLIIEAVKPHCDQATTELIKKMLKVGYINLDNINDRLDKASSGIPQGSILSPLLANIYLDKLDKFMEELQKEWNKGIRRKSNPNYNKVSLNQEEKTVIEKYPHLEKYITKAKIQERSRAGLNPRREPADPDFKRLFYVRYADDFLIGTVGTRAEAGELQNTVIEFLKKELKFEVSEEKAKIAHGSDENNIFLGTYIRWSHKPKISKLKKVTTAGGIEWTNKLTPINNALMKIPVKRLLDRAVEREFAVYRKNGIPRATAARRLSGLEDKLIVGRFSAILRGIYNYYSFCNQRSDLWPIFVIYRKACALTLANKHKLKTAASVFKKFGKYLTIPDPLGREDKKTSLFYPDSLATNVRFKTGKKSTHLKQIDAIATAIHGSYKILKKTSDICQFPGCHSKENLEEHHTNPQKNIKEDTAFNKWLISKKRKTVTLCRKHHKEVHKASA